MAEEVPPGKQTVKMSTEEINAGLLKKLQETMETGFTTIRGDMQLLHGSVDSLRDRVVIVESRLVETERRQDKNSLRAAGASQTDLSQAAALAEEKVAREDLAKKVDTMAKESAANLALTASIEDKLTKFVASPTVKILLAAVAALITGWAAGKGVHVP